MANKKKTAAPITSISAKELKFWLKGILEFQDEKWAPNSSQWASIKERIFALEETEVRYVPPAGNSGGARANMRPAQVPTYEEPVNVFAPREGGVSGLSEANFPTAAPIVPSSFETFNVPALPKPDANGFLRMPNETVQTSSDMSLGGIGPQHRTNEFGV